MRIFKFGGASIKDASSIKNIIQLLQIVGYQDVLMVISAIGKTTNSFEIVVNNYFEKSNNLSASIEDVKKNHYRILLDLIDEENNEIFNVVDGIFLELDYFLINNKSTNFNFIYDQIVSLGEILSTKILSYYLNYKGLKNNWIDVRHLIKTDENYREAEVNFEKTEKNIVSKIAKNQLNITQGFIGSDENGHTTTLGREGSDYTAAIFAYSLNSSSVTIWKDVPGVMNADPRYFENIHLINQISYKEAIEMAFYGASIIHPKTLQPLQKKEIPLYVKSFLNPSSLGTCVSKEINLSPKVSCFILKKNQLLISISSLDFSFIMEENISEIFSLLYKYKMKVSLIQNSAISFSVCVEDKFGKFINFKMELSKKFKVTYNESVSLYTIRHFDDDSIKVVEKDKIIILKQVSRETMHIITKDL